MTATPWSSVSALPSSSLPPNTRVIALPLRRSRRTSRRTVRRTGPPRAPRQPELPWSPAVATVTGLALVILIVANETVSKLIGSGSYPHQVRTEQVLRQEDVEPARRILDQARSGQRLILMQSQTYDTLIPLVRQESYGREWREGDLFQFPWGDKVVLVNTSWLMTTDVDPADPNESFQGFLERIDTTLPELEVMEQTDALLVSAGWTLRLEQDLLTLDLETSAGVVDPTKTYQLPNISIHTIDVRKFVERNRE